MLTGISDLKKVSKSIIAIKFQKELVNKLQDRTYAIVVNVNSDEYFGSIHSFINNSEQYFIIGELNTQDFKTFETKYHSIMKLVD